MRRKVEAEADHNPEVRCVKKIKVREVETLRVTGSPIWAPGA